jgi:hypothetical protein
MSFALKQYSYIIKPTGCARPNIPVSLAALNLIRAYRMVIAKYRHTLPKFKDIKLQVSTGAPSTLHGLEDDLVEGKVRVHAKGGSESLYGDVGELWFKWLHAMGQVASGLPMSHQTDLELARAQYIDIAQALSTLGMDDKNTGFCLALYMADTAGLVDHIVETGEYPENRREFVLDTVRAWGWEVPSVH